MLEKLNLFNKKAISPLKFFKNLDLGARLLFSFLFFFMFSLFLGTGVLLVASRGSRGLRVLLKKGQMDEEEIYQEISLKALYSKESLGRKIPDSAENCPQKLYKLSITGKQGDLWLAEFDRLEKYLVKNPCANVKSDNLVPGLVLELVLEKCDKEYKGTCQESESANEQSSAIAGTQVGGQVSQISSDTIVLEVEFAEGNIRKLELPLSSSTVFKQETVNSEGLQELKTVNLSAIKEGLFVIVASNDSGEVTEVIIIDESQEE